MRKEYKINISGIEVVFNLEEYSEVNKMTEKIITLIEIHDNEDYKLLHEFKMAKFAHDNFNKLTHKDSITEKYYNQYEDLLKKVEERFPDKDCE